jgi:hypothetical protein
MQPPFSAMHKFWPLGHCFIPQDFKLYNLIALVFDSKESHLLGKTTE